MVSSISGNVDVLVQLNYMSLFSNLRSTCMRMTSCVCNPKPLNHKSIIVGENVCSGFQQRNFYV
jgi:hypothetical protein